MVRILLILLVVPGLLWARIRSAPNDSTARSAAPSPGDTLVLTMHGAREAFLQRNLAVMAARYHLTSSEADLIAAGLFPNPQLSFNASYAGLFQKPADYSQTQTSYRVDQPLDLFGKRSQRITMAEHSVESARADFANTLFQMTCDFKEAFLTAAFAGRLHDLARERLALFQRTVASSATRFKTGDIAESEFTKLRLAELDYRQAESDAAQASTDAMASLRQMLVVPPDVPLRETYSFRPMLMLPSRDSLAAMAMVSRADLMAQHERTLTQQSRIDLAYRTAWPDFSIGVELDRQAPQWKNTVGGGVSLSLPLFSRNQDEIQRSEAEFEAAKLDERARENAVRNGVHAAYDKFHTSYEIFRSLSDSTLLQAADIRAAAAKSYALGNISLVDFLETERIYNDAVTSYLNALNRYAVNQVELERAVGASLFEEDNQ
ncbi:MAG TPA: TolC family protein [Bacteroidota bacterium]